MLLVDILIVEVYMSAACRTWLHRLYQSQFLISQTVSTFGKLDILVSNAAVNPVYGPILEVHNHILIQTNSLHITPICYIYCSLLNQHGTRWVINIKIGCYSNTSPNSDLTNLQIFDVNVKSAALLVKEAYPHLKASGWGQVVTSHPHWFPLSERTLGTRLHNKSSI